MDPKCNESNSKLELTNEKISVFSFFEMGESAKCLIKDCKSELKTSTPSFLLRHLRQKHPSKLKIIEDSSISSMHLPMLRLSTIILCVKHVTICGRPLISLFDESFRELLAERLMRLNHSKDHKLVITLPFIKKKILEMGKNVQDKIKLEAQGKAVSLMTDVASRHNTSILGVSIQFIDNGYLKLRTILMEKLTKSHTAKNLSKLIKEVAERYSIPLTNIFTVTSDSGANMLATTRELDDLAMTEQDEWSEDNITGAFFTGFTVDERNVLLKEIAEDLYKGFEFKPFDFGQISTIRCGSHTFQLAVKATWEKSICVNTDDPVNQVIASVRSVVKELRNTNWILELELEQMPIPQNDNKTRWFSIHVMNQSLLICKPFIEKVQARQDNSRKMKNTLTEYEWIVLAEICEIMQPAYEIMKKMQTTAYSLSDFYGAWLLIKISSIQYQKKPNRVTNLAEELERQMTTIEPKLFLNPLLLCAIFLDPRYGKKLNTTQQLVARNTLVDVQNFIKRLDKQLIENIANNNLSESRYCDLEAALNEYLDADTPSLPNPDDVFLLDDDAIALETEIMEFSKESRVTNLKMDILKYWETKKSKYPMLYKISNHIMAVPSSQTSLERAFSTFAYIFNNLRTRLDPELLQQILLIRNNPDIFKQVVLEELAKIQ